MGPAVPVLRIFDEGAARAFWLDWLGFALDWEHRSEPDLPLYAQIRRGACVLHLSGHHGDATPGSGVRIAVADIEGLLAELRRRPYTHARPDIEARPWGTREILLLDPSGNRVAFWQSGGL